jgi:hypothetical protein
LNVSAVDVVGIDVQCEANVRWNISLQRGARIVSTDTALLSIPETLPVVSDACSAQDTCDTLDVFPPPRENPGPNIPLSITLGITIPVLLAASIIIVVMAVLYYRHRKGKYHVSTGFIDQVPVSLQHYQVSYFSQSKV